MLRPWHTSGTSDEDAAMQTDRGRMGVRILGPFASYQDHRDTTPTGPKQRQILAVLTLNAGRVVTMSALAEELWDDHPPQNVASALQTLVLHLRNRLASETPGAPHRTEVIRTMFGGYLLDPSSCQTDIEEFERLARAGRAAAEAGDHRSASGQLTAALAVWRGPALADVRLGPVLEVEAASLEGTRLGVLERRLEADLVLGRHTDIVGELTLLTARHPMNENFCALLITALYRCGYVDLALAAFRRIRAVLAAELGVDPGPRLQRLHQTVLSGEAALEPTTRWSPSR
jgi:DNA-binding SARP family transcriptional activator